MIVDLIGETLARQKLMKRFSSYEPFNKMADAVLYGGLVALILGEVLSFC